MLLSVRMPLMNVPRSDVHISQTLLLNFPMGRLPNCAANAGKHCLNAGSHYSQMKVSQLVQRHSCNCLKPVCWHQSEYGLLCPVPPPPLTTGQDPELTSCCRWLASTTMRTQRNKYASTTNTIMSRVICYPLTMAKDHSSGNHFYTPVACIHQADSRIELTPGQVLINENARHGFDYFTPVILIFDLFLSRESWYHLSQNGNFKIKSSTIRH